MSTPRRRRWFDVLRRGGSDGRGGRGAPGVDEASLWAAHEQARGALGEASAHAERVAAAVAKQRGTIEAAAERASLVAARCGGLGAGATRVTEAFERLGVVALNAGLEGARAAEPQGRALLLLSEEIRANVARGAEAARELSDVVDEVSTESGEVRRQLDVSRADAGEVGQEAARLRAATDAAGRAIDELEQRLRKATGIDPEVARAMAAATDHARGLMTALSTLTTVSPAGPVLGALRPIVAPLARLLSELGDDIDAAERSPSQGPGDPNP
jgi:methyl-accepting chemotaxis protein